MTTTTKADLARVLVKKLYIDQKLAADAVDAVLAAIRDAFLEGNRVELRHFGAFNVVRTKERLGRNPNTGMPAIIPVSMRVRFRVSKLVESACNVREGLQNPVVRRKPGRPSTKMAGAELVDDNQRLEENDSPAYDRGIGNDNGTKSSFSVE